MIKTDHQEINLNVRPPRTPLPFPDFKRPQALGFYSINGKREFVRNDSQLRYFKQPRPYSMPFDLNVGLDAAIKKPDSSNRGALDDVLKFLYDHHQKIFVQRPPPEFVTFRGLLRLIMCSPYENRDDWCIHVTRFNNTIYIRQRETAQAENRRLQETEQQKDMCAWGFKFEQYCLSDSPFKDPDPSPPVNECEEFNVVFKTNLEGMSLIYGAEMDGIVSEQPVQLKYDKPDLNNVPFVELKVRQDELNEYQFKSYLRFKTKNWWCQSFLVGIKDIYVGMRNNKGIVQKIKRVNVGSLSKNGAEKFWAPWVCFNFLNEFLSCLKRITANENNPFTVFEFYFEAKKGRVCYKRLQGKTDKSFIPDWYINLIRRSNAEQR